MKKIAIHGATGSVGLNAIDIIQRYSDSFEATVLIGGKNADKLIELAKITNAPHVAISDPAKYNDLKSHLPGVKIYAGESGVLEAATIKVDTCLAAITGSAGILPTYTALPHCKFLALANKESIVAAGEQILAKAALHGTRILPVDSEHSALFQVFEESQRSALTHVTITASGGPFLTFAKDQFSTITKEMALKHPNWAMGPKVTVDCATLMNKGLEYIEAVLLFGLTPDKVKVVVHPQSIIHAMASYHDGTTLAHMGMPDMRTPIGYALGWPSRLDIPVKPLDLATLGSLTFEAPDYDRFPCLRIAQDTMETSQSARIIMNAANEVAFSHLMTNQIHFSKIPHFIMELLDKSEFPTIGSIDDVMALDRQVRAI